MITLVHPDVDGIVATRVTADDLIAFGDDGSRYDLLEGDLIRVSPAGFDHGRLAALIVARLVIYLDAHPELGIAVGGETRLLSGP